ncbi:MAG: hypothetical protein Q9174_002241 [Haloplaca sp. 1 TL-2023]
MAPSDQPSRAKNHLRGTLERRLLSDTSRIGKIATKDERHIKRQFSQRKRSQDAKVRWNNHVSRLYAVAFLMKVRAMNGKETSDVEEEWTQLARTAKKNPHESEAEQVDWVVAELRKRVQVRFIDGTTTSVAGQIKPQISAEVARAHKSQRRLLADTTAMPKHGGIPQERIKWLENVFKKHHNHQTAAEEEANETGRRWAVKYIAACRRKEGIQKKLERSQVNGGYFFHEIDKDCTVEGLEENGVTWNPKGTQWLPSLKATLYPHFDMSSVGRG